MQTSGPLVLESKEATYHGQWNLVGDTLHVEVEGKQFAVRSGGDLASSLQKFVRALGRRVLKDRVELRACVSCEHFMMSGMARDMGRGQRGMCTLHTKGVEICHLCADYRSSENSTYDRD